jgi:hypothetical protein
MPSQLEIHVEMYRWMYSGCKSDSMLSFPPPPPPPIAECEARRFTTSMLWMLISIPARAERY